MKTIYPILLLLSLSTTNSCIGCFDVLEKTYWADKIYKVSDDPANSCKTLYYKLENEDGIGRIVCITQLGYNQEYIIASSLDPSKKLEQFWILNKENDRKYKNSEDITEGPYTNEEFKAEITRLNIENIKFTNSWR